MKIIKDSKTEVFESIEPVEDRFFFNCNWLNILCKTGLTCLRCSDITEPRLCTKIERCQDGEVIFWKLKPHSRKGKHLKSFQGYVYLCSYLNRCVQCSSTGRTTGTLDTGQAAIPDRCVHLTIKVLHFHKMDIAFYNLPNSEDMFLSIFCWYVLWSSRYILFLFIYLSVFAL